MFAIAQTDLIAAKTLFENTYPKLLDICCFHCQQCAEKALKAYLLHKEIDPPKIHDLNELRRLCAQEDSSFAEIEKECSKLNPFSVASRYPNEYDIDETLTTTNINRAQQIYDFCKARVPPEASSPE